MLLCPCDGPFLPEDLCEQLLGAAGGGRQAVIPSYEGELQTTFSLWHSSVFSILEEAVLEQGKGGFKQVLPDIKYTVMDWPQQSVSPFFNVNKPEDLARAQRLL